MRILGYSSLVNIASVFTMSPWGQQCARVSLRLSGRTHNSIYELLRRVQMLSFTFLPPLSYLLLVTFGGFGLLWDCLRSGACLDGVFVLLERSFLPGVSVGSVDSFFRLRSKLRFCIRMEWQTSLCDARCIIVTTLHSWIIREGDISEWHQ